MRLSEIILTTPKKKRNTCRSCSKAKDVKVETKAEDM